jgi:hypothetical protein
VKQVVIINGSGEWGKDTFCNLCANHLKVLNISSVDKVKEAYRVLGWDGDKSEIHRKALSDIKAISINTLNHPYNYVKHNIENFYKCDAYELMFIHVRESIEIERLCNDFGCISLLIRNPNINIITSNESDANVENYNYDS